MRNYSNRRSGVVAGQQQVRMRLPENSNLRMYNHSAYMGLKVMNFKGPLIEQYLDQLHKVMHTAVNNHTRMLAIRFELNFPVGYDQPICNKVISSFFKKLRYRIKTDRANAQKRLDRAHDTTIHYVWAKESGKGAYPHYHVLLLLNHDAYKGLGSYKGLDNLYSKLRHSWAVALGLSWGEADGLVRASRNKNFDEPAEYFINFATNEGYAVFEHVFWRSSYLCKAQTKVYRDHLRSFDSSQV